jgi:endogenous inhibitor of DNA gyrase (YacG/DUF329 family)
VLELTRFVGDEYDAMCSDRIETLVSFMTSEASGADDAHDNPGAPRVSCPTCRMRVFWRGNPHRPFCSLTCRLVDLGLWLDERYRIAPPDDSHSGDASDVS